jgi:hypothetical protein
LCTNNLTLLQLPARTRKYSFAFSLLCFSIRR